MSTGGDQDLLCIDRLGRAIVQFHGNLLLICESGASMHVFNFLVVQIPLVNTIEHLDVRSTFL